MRLASVTLTGFKSFADKTVFSFDAPVTGVVGPNGCGKSNVVDAVKWVLGERSAKSLRGKEMADVIFAGSAGRPASGLASVVLTFDNPLLTPDERATKRAEHEIDQVIQPESDPHAETDTHEPRPQLESDPVQHALRIDRSTRQRRHLPIDTDTVEVERRLYRDGKSQYLINKKIARLKDIRDLFLDTGIGADAYSIIEQGKVDAMLLANPVERRIFFEEAAGIARFKARRTEAIRKLERTEVNLTRTREQLDSTERRLRIVKGQAQRARTFIELDAAYSAARLTLSFHEYHGLRTRFEETRVRLNALRSDHSASMTAVEELEGVKQDAELRRHELHRERDSIDRDRAQADHLADAATQRAALAERNIKHAKDQLAASKDTCDEIQTQTTALTDRSDTCETQIASLRAAAGEAESAFERLSEQRATHLATIAENRQALTAQRSLVSDIDRQTASLATQLEADAHRIKHFKQETTRRSEDLENANKELGVLKDQHDSLCVEDKALEDSIEVIDRTLSSTTNKLDSLHEDQTSRATQINTLEQQLAGLESRRSTLQEMADAHEGLDDAARSLLLEARDGSHPKSALHESIVGPLADLIHTEKQHAAAVEAALAEYLSAIVLSELPPLQHTIDALEGRVRFLPLTACHSPTATIPPDDGLTVVRLSALVSATDKTHVPLVQRLLHNTALVNSLESALLLAAGPLRGMSFVTPNGDRLDPDGSVLIGSEHESDNAGILARAAELDSLHNQIDGLAIRVAEEREALSLLSTQSAELDQQRSSLQSELTTAHQRRASLLANIDRAATDRDRLLREIPSIRTEREQLKDRTDLLEAEQTEHGSKLDSLKRLHTEELDRVHTLETAIDERLAESERLSDQLSLKRSELTTHAERLTSAEREQRHTKHQLDDLAQQLQRSQDAVHVHTARIEEESEALSEARTQLREAEDAESTAQERLSQIVSSLSAAAEEVVKASDALNEAKDVARSLDSEYQSLELLKRELEVKRDAAEARAAEELAIDLLVDYPEYQAFVAHEPDSLEATNPTELSAEIRSLKKEIKQLGNINLDAIQEEDNLAERNETLIAQVADIDAARLQLESVIDRLSELSLTRFKSAFHTIQQNFSGKDGMFRKLFGGGNAHIELIPHPETGEIDYLESGIQVTAKPPGKEPRSIAQLSGGEKTMTAVAILLAIFESKPSPFCILDEVDAALDDANVERYARVIRQFLEYCHFIVITHNKRTMQSADVLYGITMQERGVSTRVPVHFEHVNEDGSFATVSGSATSSLPSQAATIEAKSEGVDFGDRSESMPEKPHRFSDILREHAETEA